MAARGNRVDEGRAGDPRRGRQTFRRYVEDEWLPGHVMELRTLENYTYYLDRRILPEFGPMRMSRTPRSRTRSPARIEDDPAVVLLARGGLTSERTQGGPF